MVGTGRSDEEQLVAQGQQVTTRDENRGLAGALYKLLKPPEVWKPETREQEHATWQEFSFALRAYLTAPDEKFSGDFKSLEGRYEILVKMNEMEENTRKRGTVLYAILTSLVQGRPQKTLKLVEPGNGYECYRRLAEQATPQLRARALALLQSVLQFTFSKSKTLVENLQRLEDLVKEYEGASKGKQIHDDVLVGILLKNAPNQVRNWMLVNLKDDTPYAQVPESLKSWDVQTYKWSESINYYQRYGDGTAAPDGGPRPWKWTAYRRARAKENRKERQRKGRWKLQQQRVDLRYYPRRLARLQPGQRKRKRQGQRQKQRKR